MKIYAIRDNKAEYCYPPQVFRNAGDAIRACANSVNHDPSSLFSKNAEDFSLFEIGEYDERKGQINAYEKRHVTDLVDLREDASPKMPLQKLQEA